MLSLLPSQLSNPFVRSIVDDPRDVTLERSVGGIHASAFDTVLTHFASIEAQPIPRLAGGPLALPLLSQEPGTGKSHLIRRLWLALATRATPVFLRANQDHYQLWARLLERTLQELERPADDPMRLPKLGEPTALDLLARHLISFLLIQADEASLVELPSASIDRLRNDPSGFETDRELTDFLNEQVRDIARLSHSLLLSLGVHLHSPDFLQVLIRYTVHPSDFVTRSAALLWITGNHLDEEDQQKLGFPSTPPRGESPQAIDALCQHRLRDLCVLGSFSRPFVFAFDQTEVYARSEKLAREVGAQIADIQSTFRNQLTLLTANEAIWHRGLLDAFEPADAQRFGPPIFLRGISLSQARELIDVKMRAAGHEKAAIADFLKSGWLEDLFQNQGEELPPRIVERQASNLLQNILKSPLPSPGADIKASPLAPVKDEETSAIPKTTPLPRSESVFDFIPLLNAKTHHAQLSPRGTDYDKSVTDWCLSEGLSRVPDLTTSTACRASWKHVRASWRTQEGTIFFGIESLTHPARWEEVVTELGQAVSRDDSESCHAAIFWLPRPTLPSGEAWENVRNGRGVTLIPLKKPLIAEMFAAQALAAEILQAAHPGVTPGDFLRFLGTHWSPWVKEVIAQVTRPQAFSDEALTALVATPAPNLSSPAKAEPKVIALPKGSRPVVVAVPKKPVAVAMGGAMLKPSSVAVPVAVAKAQESTHLPPTLTPHAGLAQGTSSSPRLEGAGNPEAKVRSADSAHSGPGSPDRAPLATPESRMEDLVQAIRREVHTLKTVDWPTLRDALQRDFAPLDLKDALSACRRLSHELVVWPTAGSHFFLWTAHSESAPSS